MTSNIRVIQESVADEEETAIDNFNKIKPFLDEGYGYNQSVVLSGLCKSRPSVRYRWFRNIVEYGESQGYPYRKRYYKKKEIKD